MLVELDQQRRVLRHAVGLLDLHGERVARLARVQPPCTSPVKTTMLNCLAAAIPGGHRIVSAVEVFELRVAHFNRELALRES